MSARFGKLAATAESVAAKLEAAGEQRWQPVVGHLASRLRGDDASAVPELLDVINRPDGLGELVLTPKNAPQVTAFEANTLNRVLRDHIEYLDALARCYADQVDQEWTIDEADEDGLYTLQDEPDDDWEVDAIAPPLRADTRTLEERMGPLPPGPIDWFRVVFHGLFGAITGGFVGALIALRFLYLWLPDGSPMPFIIGGAVIGGLAGAVFGHGFWDWLFSRPFEPKPLWRYWTHWWWPWR